MKSAIVHLVGESSYSQSKHYTEGDEPICGIDPKKKPKELHDAYEQRTWRHRMHVTKDGYVEIPGSSFSICMQSAAKRLRLQIPGKGKSEYTKHFEAGIMVKDGLVLPIKAADVLCDKLFVPSDGTRGGGNRVTKYFPRIELGWEGKVTYFIFDDIITEDIFHQVLRASGQLVGIGRFRPEKCGSYGRFSIKSIRWLEEEATMAALSAA